MSSRLVGWAISTVPKEHPQLSQPARHLLILLADHFNENEGAAWPSHQRLADIMGAEKRSVIRWMHELKDAGIVGQTMRTNNSNLYKLGGDLKSPGVTKSHMGGDTQSPVGVTSSHTNSYRTLKEPCDTCENGWIERDNASGFPELVKCPKGCQSKSMTHLPPTREA
jgi:hypothetical protein